MKLIHKTTALLTTALLMTTSAWADMDKEKNFNPRSVSGHQVIQVMAPTDKGVATIGDVVVIETAYGLAFFPELKGLAPGMHGFHIHEKPSCEATEKGFGMKAGGHWDPENTKTHSFPWDDAGHKGDLPALFADEDGAAHYPVLAPKIKKISEIEGRSLMIHAGGDNHSDHPKPLGGGGARMACGVIK